MSQLAAWERRTQWWLVAAALVFLVAYAVPILWPAAGLRAAGLVVMAAVWVLFWVDYVVRLALAPDRGQFVRRNIFDLVTLVLPMLRPLRIIALLNLIRVFNRAGLHSLQGRVVLYAGSGSVLAVLVCSLAVTDAERDAPGSLIDGFGDGLWWAIVTISTVGYGDLAPVTATGRFVAVALMLGGIALLGVVSGTLASWLVERIGRGERAAATRGDVAELSEQVRALRAELRRRDETGESVPD